MQLSCIHCGQAFTITKEQLGGRGSCPHCRGVIQLPQAENGEPEAEPEVVAPSRWWENSVSALVSVVLHILLMLILALVAYDAQRGEGLGEDVMIGELPSELLSDAQEDELSLEEETSEPAEEEFDEMLEVEISVEPTNEVSVEVLTEMPISSGGGSRMAFDWQPTAGGGSLGGGGGWDGLLQQLRRNGLDIVLAFDSTSSMSGEIARVKEQIRRIGTTLNKLIPKTRISICTYRDERDLYVVKGLPLTNDIAQIDSYLRDIHADGGGDLPEAVHEGLGWSVKNNKFRSTARKVILLFGDAPPHPEYMEACLHIAADFRNQGKGIVSTVTCHLPRTLREFDEIAQMGGGESFLASDERQIMTQLMVLVFGSRHRSKVVEAFKLMGR